MKISKFGSTVGWVGNAILSIGLIPYAWTAWHTHDVTHLSWIFLLTWFFGILLSLIYIIEGNFRHTYIQWPLWMSYSINIVITFYLCYVKIMY